MVTVSKDEKRSVIGGYVAIARPDHWFKNIFMLPGFALALIMSQKTIDAATLLDIAIAILATCLIASANYTINEWLDAEFDRHHPVKKERPSVSGNLVAPLVYTQWLLLSAAGLGLSLLLSYWFLCFEVALLLMGLAYNVRPIRTKDRLYLDVLSESINNPLRFMLGWSAIVTIALPPSSIIIAYWMGGAYLMAIKRYAEYRFIGDPERAKLYRRSFGFYTEESLMVSAFFYALLAAFFLGIFLIKYRIEFLVLFPFLALLFSWYLKIGMQSDSVAQKPERLYGERRFVVYVIFLGILVTFLFFVDLPWLNILVEDHILQPAEGSR